MNAISTAPTHQLATAPIPEAEDAPPIRISESDRLASVVSRGHAIDADAAKLMPLQLVGAFAGRTTVIRSVDGLVCSAGFDLAMIGSDRAMVHGATMALLDEILGEFEEARNRETDEGRDQVRHRYSALMSKRKDLFTERNAAEEKLRKVNAVPMTTQEAEANRTEYRTVVEKVRGRQILEAQIGSLTRQIVAVEQEMTDWRFASAPGIIRDGELWEKFPDAGTESFDGHFLQVGTAKALLEEYQALPPKWFQESVHLLRRSGNESPFSSMARSRESTTCSVQISGDPFAFSRLFHDTKFSKCGLFSGFLLVGSDDENASPDAEAMDQLVADGRWRIILSGLLNDRLAGIQRHLHLDRQGIQCCLDFRDWYQDFLSDIPEQHHWSFSGWPNLLVQMALGMAIIEGQATGEVLDVGFLHEAAKLLKGHAPRQVGLLDTMLPKMEVTDLFEDRLDRLVGRLINQGPMTKRQLARTINGHDYGVIDTLLAEGKHRGLLFQKAELFFAVAVNVNGSASNAIVDFQGGVAA